MTQPHLTPVPDDGPFVYPIAKADRLDGLSFVKWQHQRWLASDMFMMATAECKGHARDLFDIAQTQSPPGTLPRDMAYLARLLRCDLQHFEGLCKQRFGPLHGWMPCITQEGELRLWHRTVLEQVQDAFDRREAKALANTRKAIDARRDRLVSALRAMGCVEDMLADDVLIERMDTWLSEHWKKPRKPAAYEAVLRHAQKEGWLGRRNGRA